MPTNQSGFCLHFVDDLPPPSVFFLLFSSRSSYINFRKYINLLAGTEARRIWWWWNNLYAHIYLIVYACIRNKYILKWNVDKFCACDAHSTYIVLNALMVYAKKVNYEFDVSRCWTVIVLLCALVHPRICTLFRLDGCRTMHFG